MFEFKISFGSSKKEKPTKIDEAETNQNFEDATSEIVRKVLMEENGHYAKLDQKEGKPPIVGGRSSIPQAISMFAPGKLTPVITDFPFEQLQFIQGLAMWNRHISQAVENIVTLGNTDYEINFGDDTPDELSEEMRKHIRRKVKTWYGFSEGENSLDTDLLAQMATTGCISAEAVPAITLDGIEKIVRVDPFSVRFAYDKDTDEFIPLQKADFLGMATGNHASPGYVELNINQYCYLAMRRFNEFPYAIPPFLSAIEDVIIENDMVKNFANMMRRMGMMGFLSVLLTLPKRNNNETEEKYNASLSAYLEKMRPGIEAGFHKGVLIGFKDSHEIKVNNHPNTTGASDLLNTVHKLIYSGVKQDPSMHGENFSTTETFARVIISKMSTQVKSYQKTLGEFKSRIFKLELILAGFRVDVVEVNYDIPSITDRKEEAETEKIEIENSGALYNAGLISQIDRAKRHDIDEPDMDEPRFNDMLEVNMGGDNEEEEDTGGRQAAEKAPVTERGLQSLLVRLGGGRTEFNYFIPEPCSDHPDNRFVTVTDFAEPRMKRFVQSYVNDVDELFVDYINLAVKRMHTEVRKLREDVGENHVATVLKYNLYNGWTSQFVVPVGTKVDEHIDEIYGYYRKDDKVFKDSANFNKRTSKNAISFFTVPDAMFELIDARAVEFLAASDQLWLGKFITDQDTVKRINKFIEKELLEKNLAIGPNSEALHAFIERFGDTILLERYKIRRILETTANRARSMANVLYINQAGVENYRIIEVGDERTCPWCNYMNNTVFSVAPTVEKIQKLSEQNFENLPEISPFATSTPIDQFTKLSAVELQAMGIDVPSYHPSCRGRVISEL